MQLIVNKQNKRYEKEVDNEIMTNELYCEMIINQFHNISFLTEHFTILAKPLTSQQGMNKTARPPQSNEKNNSNGTNPFPKESVK